MEILNTGSYHPLPADYRAAIDVQTTILAVFVGKDPFPTAPVGLPFCKDTWAEQLKDNCSGKHLLQSIGVDVQRASQTYSTPKDLFIALARQGILMLNASYHFLGARDFQRVDVPLLEEANTVNLPVIGRAQRVFLLGQAKVLLPYVQRNFPEMKDKVVPLIHPDVQNRKFKRAKWEEIWLPNVLKERLKLQLAV